MPKNQNCHSGKISNLNFPVINFLFLVDNPLLPSLFVFSLSVLFNKVNLKKTKKVYNELPTHLLLKRNVFSRDIAPLKVS